MIDERGQKAKNQRECNKVGILFLKKQTAHFLYFFSILPQ